MVGKRSLPAATTAPKLAVPAGAEEGAGASLRWFGDPADRPCGRCLRAAGAAAAAARRGPLREAGLDPGRQGKTGADLAPGLLRRGPADDRGGAGLAGR